MEKISRIFYHPPPHSFQDNEGLWRGSGNILRELVWGDENTWIVNSVASLPRLPFVGEVAGSPLEGPSWARRGRQMGCDVASVALVPPCLAHPPLPSLIIS